MAESSSRLCQSQNPEATGRYIDSRKLGLERTFDLFENRRRTGREPLFVFMLPFFNLVTLLPYVAHTVAPCSKIRVSISIENCWIIFDRFLLYIIPSFVLVSFEFLVFKSHFKQLLCLIWAALKFKNSIIKWSNN